MLSNELTIYLEDEVIFKAEYVECGPVSELVEEIEEYFADFDNLELEDRRQIVDVTEEEDDHKDYKYGARRIDIVLSLDDKEIARKDVSIPVSDIN